jgi:hypothetical protein
MALMDSRERRILLASVIELTEAMKLAQLTRQDNWLDGMQTLYVERCARLENGRFYSESGNPGVEPD